MEQLTMVEKEGANYILLELTGTVTTYTTQELQEKVFSYVLRKNLVLDLSEVTSIDSVGVGIIMGGYNDALDNKHKLYVMNPSGAVHEALEDTGFLDTFFIIHSVTEVIE